MTTPTKTFISLTNDLLFKETLAHIDNRDVLEDILEVFLGLNEGSLKGKLNVEYQSLLKKKKFKDKEMWGDLIIKCDKTIVDLEMYSVFKKEYIYKSWLYAIKLQSGINRGVKYHDVDRVIQINLIDKVETKRIPKDIELEYMMYNAKHQSSLIEDKFLVYYYRIDEVKKKSQQDMSRLEKYLALFGAKNEKERAKIAKGDEKMQRLLRWIRKYLVKDEFEEMKRQWNKETQIEMNYALARYDIMENLVPQVVKEATEAAKDEITGEIVAKMVDSGCGVEDIKKYTGLSAKQINSLSAKLKKD